MKTSHETQKRVVHFGPALDTQGGMASVLRTYRQHAAGTSVAFVTTYHPTARLFSLVWFVRALRVVLGLDRHEVRALHFHLSERGSFVREGLLVRIAISRRLPTFATIHGADFVDFASKNQRLVRWVLGHCTRVFVLGEAALEMVRACGIQAAEILANPVTIPNAGVQAGNCPPIVLFGGEVGTRKGVDVLLRAWPAVLAAHPTAQLIIAGPDGDVAPVDTKNVQWLGPLPHGKLIDRIATCRVAVLPSRAEGMPIFILEAMAAGKPVVASTAGAMSEQLGDTGTLVPVGDPMALADALVANLDSTTASIEGGRCRARAIAHYSAGEILARLAGAYEHTEDAKSVYASPNVSRLPVVHRIRLFGAPVDVMDSEAVVKRIERAIAKRTPLALLSVNLHWLSLLQRDPTLIEIAEHFDLSLVDGMPVRWATNTALGTSSERHAGADLVPMLCQLSAERGYRLFFLGAAPGVAAQAAEVAASRFPGCQVVGVSAPSREDLLDFEMSRNLCDQINASRADVLFVALGMPLQERWLADHRSRLEAPVRLAIGGSLDMLAGRVRRAPRAVQALGAEWLWRLACEPQRLWRRYLVDDLPVGLDILRFIAAAQLQPTGLDNSSAEVIDVDLRGRQTIDLRRRRPRVAESDELQFGSVER